MCVSIASEHLRECKAGFNRGIRAFERTRIKLEADEKQLTGDIKKALQKGDTASHCLISGR